MSILISLKRLHLQLAVVVVVVVVGHLLNFVATVGAQQVPKVEPIQRREDVLQKVAEGKTNARAISRVTSPQEAWEQIQLRDVEELKLMMKELIDDGILSDIDVEDDLSDDSADEDSIRSLAYDEDVIELWFKKHPEDITKYKPKPKPKKSPPKRNEQQPSSQSSPKSTSKKKITSRSSSVFSIILDQLCHVGNIIQNLFSSSSSSKAGGSDNDSEL